MEDLSDKVESPTSSWFTERL